MPTNPPALEVEGLTLSWDRTPVVKDVSFALPPGRIVGVLGPNGAGKSTMLKGILGLMPRDRGEVRAFGKALNKVRGRVVYVPQRSAVDWDFPVTVNDVVLMGRYGHLGLLGRLRANDRAIADDAMERMAIADLRDRQISELSGGQQQRVFLARALAQQGDLLLMDEPLVGVDARTEAVIIDLLRAERDAGKTVLIVNHDLNTAREYFDDLLLLNKTVIAYGPSEAVFEPEALARCYGGQLAVLRGADGARHMLAG